MSYLLDYTGQEVNENLKAASNIFNLIYPVGSIYMSVNSTSPATLFGGTWEQIQNRFLLSAGSSYSAGATGGEATHKLTTAEMPSHQHEMAKGSAGTQSGMHTYDAYTALTNEVSVGSYYWYSHTANIGDSTAHNNMPPYLVVYMWKRTA